MRSRTPYIILAAAIAAAALFWTSHSYFRSGELARAEARLALYRSTVEAEIKRFSHLTYVLARDPFVLNAALGRDPETLNARLKSFSQRAGLDAIYLMDAGGLTLAASNAGEPVDFVGGDFSFRPYFQEARAGGQGQFYGIGTTSGRPGYFLAEPVMHSGQVRGVIAIKIDLSPLQDSWQDAAERVILSNADGVTLLSSVSEWRYRTLAPLTNLQRSRITATRQFGTQPLLPMDWSPTDRQSVDIDGQNLLYLSRSDLPNGWTLHYLAPGDRAVLSSWLVTASFVFLAGLALMLRQVMRTRAIGAALRESVEEEANLRETNARLAIEIEDRRAAELALRKTQAELERAGRLAALGQLAASVTHELGQPITAMRNHLTALEMQSGSALATGRLQGLVDRMEGITRQLKFFSRKGRDKFESVDLSSAVEAVLDLVDPNIEELGAEIRFAGPDAPVRVHANRLRLEQVITNLMRNALDAVAEEDERQIEISLGQGDGTGWFEVCDSGHGLGGQTLDDLKEPFATTRESGQGMGLGLTISAGIIEDHDGQLTARNLETGGAAFRVSLPLALAREDAA